MTDAQVIAAGGDPPPADAVGRAVAHLRTGALVGVPTDTIYGIAADPRSAEAAAAVFRAKERPADVELPVLVGSIAQAEELAGPLSPGARALAERWWPGPLTLVLPRRAGIELHLGGDGSTVGVRRPAHPVAAAVCRGFGPIIATSANRHGAQPANTAAEVALVPGVTLVLDVGACPGRPSTVVGLHRREPSLLREGAVPWEDIVAVLDRVDP